MAEDLRVTSAAPRIDTSSSAAHESPPVTTPSDALASNRPTAATAAAVPGADTARAVERNRSVLDRTYSAFANHDPQTMVTAYADNATFEDPVYGKLTADQTRKMWGTLAASKSLAITYEITPSAEGGVVAWKADYVLNGNKVHNEVTSNITMADGKIIAQRDTFDFAKWAAQASPGLIGTLAQHGATAWLAHLLIRSVAHKKVGI